MLHPMAHVLAVVLALGVSWASVERESAFKTAMVRLKPPFDDAQGGPELVEGPDATYGFGTGSAQTPSADEIARRIQDRDTGRDARSTFRMKLVRPPGPRARARARR